jgi:hypothetical protein
LQAIYIAYGQGFALVDVSKAKQLQLQAQAGLQTSGFRVCSCCALACRRQSGKHPAEEE